MGRYQHWVSVIEEALSRSSLRVLGQIGAADRRTDRLLIRSTVKYLLVGIPFNTRSQAPSAVEAREDAVVLDVESVCDYRFLSALPYLVSSHLRGPLSPANLEAWGFLGAQVISLFFHNAKAIARRLQGGLVSVASVSPVLPA